MADALYNIFLNLISNAIWVVGGLALAFLIKKTGIYFKRFKKSIVAKDKFLFDDYIKIDPLTHFFKEVE